MYSKEFAELFYTLSKLELNSVSNDHALDNIHDLRIQLSSLRMKVYHGISEQDLDSMAEEWDNKGNKKDDATYKDTI